MFNRNNNILRVNNLLRVSDTRRPAPFGDATRYIILERQSMPYNISNCRSNNNAVSCRPCTPRSNQGGQNHGQSIPPPHPRMTLCAPRFILTDINYETIGSEFLGLPHPPSKSASLMTLCPPLPTPGRAGLAIIKLF